MRQTELFSRTGKEAPKDDVSVNARLLTRGGFIDKLSSGVYTFLPMGLRVLRKIEDIIRDEMDAVGGQEILMPALSPKENWDTTGRWDSIDVLFKLSIANGQEFTLGATHEEVVTPLMSKFVLSYKDLPRSVYQIQTKFRAEPRAKSGVLRCREFRMKDLYSFHTEQSELDKYYETVKQVYKRIFERVGLGGITYLTFASGGDFSKYSHEFQTVTSSGEDTIYICGKCDVAINKEIFADTGSACPQCQSKDLREARAIEVGNIFKLGTRFSGSFDFCYVDAKGEKRPVVMGCYGIGSSRLLGAVVEVHHDKDGIRWPSVVAPYTLHLISLIREDSQRGLADELYDKLTRAGIEVLYDDRTDTRAGAKFADSDLIGIPTRVVISDMTLKSESVEVKTRGSEETKLVHLSELVSMYA